MNAAAADFSEVPIVDLSPAGGSPNERKALAEHIGEICHRVGFLIVTGHGVSQSTIDGVFDTAGRLFELPLEQKLLIDKRKSRHFRGWEPEGTEYTNNRPDIREQVDVWTEHPARDRDVTPSYLRLLGPNQWLPEDVLPGFRSAVERWIGGAEALSWTLMGLLAESLELSTDHFERLFGDERMSLTKIIRYPPTPPGQFGVNAHHDTGFVTILAPGGKPGLEVESPSGQWIPVPVVPGALVVNLGEMLQKMTGNYFVATPHRVVTTQPRQSVGYFHGPSLPTRIAPLPLNPRFAAAVAASPRHARAGFMAQRDETQAGVGDMGSPHHPDVYGEQLWNYFARSYPGNVERHYPN